MKERRKQKKHQDKVHINQVHHKEEIKTHVSEPVQHRDYGYKNHPGCGC